jgi:amino acid adenylation domain-containing protein
MEMQDVSIEGFQLSPQQRRLWTLTRGHKGESPYTSHCVVTVRGPVDLRALRAALDRLSIRHEILRTSFYAPEELSTALQIIAPAGEAAADFHSVESLSSDEHRIALRLPALLCDARGLKNLVTEIAAAYDATLRAADAEGDVLQYADASIWLNETLEAPESAAGRRFWESGDLSDLLRIRLPFERDPRSDAPFNPRRVSVRLPDGCVEASRRLSAEHGVQPEAFVLACWQCLLQRTVDTSSVVIGYLTDGRGFAELEPAVGLFARCLPLRGNLPDGLPFTDAVQHLASAVSDAKRWGECFDWRTVPGDREGRPPFVPFVFEHQDRTIDPLTPDVVFTIDDLGACVDRFTLKLCCASSRSELQSLWLEYDSAICREDDIVRLGAQLEALMASAAGQPSSPLGRLQLLPSSQEQEILDLSNRESRSGPSSSLVHRLFEDQAARIPGATAVVFEDVRLTYAELNTRANQLAGHLRTMQVGPDTLVGLCVDRSVDIAVGILGILKAGGAYVPLDPRLPEQRLKIMLAESGARVAVSRATLAGWLDSSMRAVLLDEEQTTLASYPGTNTTSAVGPGHLAYVLFTSGSTGKPKGVAVEHRQLASYVEAVSAGLELPAAAAFATVTTFASDLGNTAIYPALTRGGQLHIISEECAGDPNAFGDYVDRHPIDVLKIVPSHLDALLSGARPARVLPRERLVLGGEACPWELVDKVRRLAPGCAIFNHYGPTETTVGATMYRVPDDGARPPSRTVPIGRPLSHAQAYVLDRHGQTVALWTTGELHIGGDGVARGYLGDTALTNDKFVADARAGSAGARMYRTGDRVRMLPGGLLEFLGRFDSQLKIRGFRVELGEIEAALRRHPDLANVSVLAPRQDGDTRLAAFFVSRNGERPRPPVLRAFLEQAGLPDYMIPGAFVGVDALPLTPNGKLDHRRLLALLEVPAAAPSDSGELTEWEAIVAAIWQELLGLDRIEPSDNFYDLGGHSLMAIQVVSALERRARVQVSPRDLVFHTLKQFAALCASKGVATS